jgi:hypothetical protein
MINPQKGIDLMNNTSIIIRILFAVTIFQQDAHEYVFVFQNLNILCIFSDRFFDLVFFWFRFGSGFWGRPVKFW